MKKLDHIAYNKLEGKSPTVVFLSGFRSDMEGTKALFLESVCAEIGQSFIRFDYSGHGKSGGEFKDCTIGLWRDDALKIVDELTDGPVVLVGSSMGGWIMLLVALARPERIKALIGIAAAPDFTEELIWEKFSDQERKQILDEGQVLIPNCYEDQEPYPITRKLIEEARGHLVLTPPLRGSQIAAQFGGVENKAADFAPHPIATLLDSPSRGELAINCPVWLMHGMKDADVPYQTSLRLEEKLESEDIMVRLVKNGDHRMSAPENLELLREFVLAMIER